MNYQSRYDFSFKLPTISELLEAGVQFGHQTRRWNPKMREYIYTSKGGIHIIDISYTLPMLEEALNFLRKKASQGNVLFVGTKRQAREMVEEKAIECGAFYVVDRWPGGLLTNFEMTKKNLKRLNQLEKELKGGVEDRTKQEIMWMKTEWERLDRLYRGIKTMTRKPTAMVVVDVKLQEGPINEARHLGIPIVGLTDTNVDPDKVDYLVPGNDDAMRSLELFISLFAKAVAEGNKGRGVRHEREDLMKLEVKRITRAQTSIADIKKQEGSEEKKTVRKVRVVARGKVKVDEKKETSKQESKTKKPKNKIGGSKAKTASKVATSKEPKSKTKTQQEKQKDLDNLELSARVKKSLKDAGVKYDDLVNMKDAEILDVKGIGNKALEEIKKAIK